MAARTLLLTRPHAQSRAFAAVLEAELPGRFRPVIAPLLTIVPQPGPVDLTGLQGLMFTSANGVEQFAALSAQRELPAFCVGDITAAAARAAGFEARSADGDVEALAALVAAAHRPGGGAFLHVRGRHAASDLIGRLAASGVPGRVAEIYGQAPQPIAGEARTLLEAGRAEVLTFFSPRTARLFTEAARAAGWSLGSATAVSLSAAADAALDLPVASRRVAAAPTRTGMLEALAAT